MRRASIPELALIVGLGAWIVFMPWRPSDRIDVATRPVVSATGPTAQAIRALPLQALAEAALVEPDVGLAAIRVSDGKVLALASSTGRGAPSLAYQVGLKPGSALKPYFYAAAVDVGVLGADEVLPERLLYGPPGGYAVRNSSGEVCPATRWVEALARSCNTAMVEVGERLGVTRLNDLVGRIRSLLAGTEVVVGGPMPRAMVARERLPDTLTALLLGGAEWRITPLHLASLLAAVGREGRFIQASLEGGATRSHRVMSERAASLVAEGMRAGAEHGTASALRGLGVAAKTGTAERFGTRDGWVGGYWPAVAPQIAFAVVALGNERKIAIGPGTPSTVAARFIRSLGNPA